MLAQSLYAELFRALDLPREWRDAEEPCCDGPRRQQHSILDPPYCTKRHC